MLKIALAQINSCVADLEGNSRKIIANIKKARNLGADLVAFPELALVGYPPEDLLLKLHFIEHNLRYLKIIKEACADIIALVGFVDRKKDKIFNSYAFIQNKKIVDIYHKIILPNYGVFDEKRYFTAGSEISFYHLEGYKFSVNICEDIWDVGIVDNLKGKNLDFIVNLSASPFHLGKVILRAKVLSQAAEKINTYIFYCNLVGGQDELVFDGTSKIFSPQGTLIRHSKRFYEDFTLLTLDKKKEKKRRPQKLIIEKEKEAFCALRLGLIDYVRKNGFKKVIVGVSGGIDSAVVIALAVMALGKNNVCALIMPSRYTSQATFKDAQKICENLGVKYHIAAISGILSSYLNHLAPFLKNTVKDKTEENLQARIRGNILMAFSNKFSYLVLNTGNKSEVSCGYCTLYGDMVGGFGILKDVPKMLVYKIAHYINKVKNTNIIPVSVIKRPPSAELRFNQKDTDSLPSYRLLDPILKLYVEEDYSRDEIVKKGFNRSLVNKVIKLVDTNEYKRRQSPVGIKITPRAFGKDRRMPITRALYDRETSLK